MAETYATISYGYDNEVFKSEDDMSEALNHMDKMIKDDIFDHVRFVFNIPEGIENPEATINYLKERYKSNDQIKVVIEHGYIEEKRKREKEQIDEVDKKFSFVLDKNLSLEDKVSYFISITVDKDISVEDVSFYLYTPLNEILEQTIK
jgi:type III secretory pathway component EscV